MSQDDTDDASSTSARDRANPDSDAQESDRSTSPPLARSRAGNPAAAAASRARRIGGRAVDQPDGAAGSASSPRAEGSPADAAGLAQRSSSPDRSADPASESSASAEMTSPRSVRGRGTAARVVRAPVLDEPQRESRARWWPAAILSIGVVALAVVLTVTALGGGSASGQARRDQVLAAAKACVVSTNSYTYKDLSGFERKGLACGTGTFAVKFKQSVDSILKKIAPTVKQVQTFQVNTAGITDVAGDTWTILVYGQTRAVNVGHTDGETDPYGAVVTMVNKNGRWLMSNLNTLCTSSLSTSGNACV